MPVYYGGNNIEPGPFVNIRKVLARGEGGRLLRKFFALTVKGKLIADKGSPLSNGTFNNSGTYPTPPENIGYNSRLTAIRSKQAALINLFSTDALTFEIDMWDNAAPIKCNPVVKGGVQFAEGLWATECEYTVEMEAENIFFGDLSGGGTITGVQAEESWSIEIENPVTRTYRVSHTVSSQQHDSYDETGTLTAQGWQNALAVVTPYLGSPLPGGIVPPELASYQAANYTRGDVVDESGGRYTATESWVYTPDALFVEEFSVTTRVQEGQTRVTVEGTVTGYVAADPSLTPEQFQAGKFAQALAAWDAIRPELLTRAQNYSATTLHPTSLNESFGQNPVAGTVNYTWEFDNRPASFIPGALSETFSIQKRNPADVFASLVVLGRAAGPVLQDVGTTTARTTTVTLEAVMPPWTYSTPMPDPPDVTAALLEFYPPGGFTTEDAENFVPRTGRYSRSITWTFEGEGP